MVVRLKDIAAELGVSVVTVSGALRDGVVAWIESRLSFPMTQMDYAAMLSRRTESGQPASSNRLRTATPTAASTFWQEKLRARRQGPMMALYRPIAVSTRARWP